MSNKIDLNRVMNIIEETIIANLTMIMILCRKITIHNNRILRYNSKIDPLKLTLISLIKQDLSIKSMDK